MEGHEACAYYSEKLNWMLDPFHAKGHVVNIMHDFQSPAIFL